MNRILLISLIAVIVISCKKDPQTISISGQVIDPYQNIPVAGVKVTLQANGVVEGVYNASYVTLGIFTTNTSGEFSFIIDESAYDSFRLSFLKDNYYFEQTVVSAGSISPEDPYERDFDLFSKSVIRLHIKNASPVDDSDKLTISFTNNPVDDFGCCSNTPKSFEGMSIDTTFTCNSVGAYNLMLYQAITKNSAIVYHTDIIETIPCDTIDVELLY